MKATVDLKGQGLTLVRRGHLGLGVGHYFNVGVDTPLQIGFGHRLDSQDPFGYDVAQFLLEAVVELQA